MTRITVRATSVEVHRITFVEEAFARALAAGRPPQVDWLHWLYLRGNRAMSWLLAEGKKSQDATSCIAPVVVPMTSALLEESRVATTADHKRV